MNTLTYGGLALIVSFLGMSCAEQEQRKQAFNTADMIVRIAEIEIDTAYVDEYITILKEEAAASVTLEEGVLCIFPIYQTNHPTDIRLLEIYANEDAYQSHLQSPHFLHYKRTTHSMVKSLTLLDMEAIDKEMMTHIFKKIMR